MKVNLEKNKGQQIYTITQGQEFLGCLVIDSMVGGRSCGGLRMLPDIDQEEISGLASSMTLKYGFLGLPQGGAKAGVRGNPESPKSQRRKQLKDFAAAVSPLLRSHAYVPGTDMGTDNSDIRYLLRSAGLPIKFRELRGTHSGYYTALTVMAGVEQAVKHLGLKLDGCTVAIEGFGKVGSALAELLTSANASVVAISTSKGAIYNPQGLDVKKLTKLTAKKGSRVVEAYRDAKNMDCAELLELPVDILCPCARHNSLNIDNAESVQARIVCPGANNPVTHDAEYILSERGVLCMPDFVTNCGGVLGGTMEFASVSRSRIESFIRCHIGRRIAWVLQEAEQHRVLPRKIAVAVARRGFRRVQQNATYPTPWRRLFGFGLELYRRGFIPGSLVAILSLPYFEKSLERGFPLENHGSNIPGGYLD